MIKLLSKIAIYIHLIFAFFWLIINVFAFIYNVNAINYTFEISLFLPIIFALFFAIVVCLLINILKNGVSFKGIIFLFILQIISIISICFLSSDFLALLKYILFRFCIDTQFFQVLSFFVSNKFFALLGFFNILMLFLKVKIIKC